MANAEAVLLSDNDQTHIVKVLRVLQYAVGADDDVDSPGTHSFDNRFYFLGALEAGQHLDAHRPVGKAVAEGLAVLLGQQCRRDEYHDLLAVVHGCKAGSQGNLGLAEADVTAHHAIHRLVRRQVCKDIFDRMGLVLG